MVEPKQGISIPPNIKFLEDFVEGEPIDQLRLYDDQIKNWVLTFLHPKILDRNKNVKKLQTQFATPDRAYAEQRNLLNSQVEESKRRHDAAMTPEYPACSITRLSPVLDFGRRHHRAIFRRAGFVDRQTTDEVYQMPYPSTWDIPYQLDFASINRYTLNLIQNWVMLQFDDDKFYITIDFKQVHPIAYQFPYKVPVVLESLNDTSELEPGENDRLLRFTLDVTVKALIVRPVRRRKVVKKVVFDFCEAVPQPTQKPERIPAFVLGYEGTPGLEQKQFLDRLELSLKC